MSRWYACIIALCWAQVAWANTAIANLIVIIDDVGYNRPLGQACVDLPAPLNLAFLPNTPYATPLAQSAHERSHGIMLHLPMENEQGLFMAEDTLLSNMSEAQTRDIIRRSLQQIPHVQGVNNHMGSVLTQRTQNMQWLMDELVKHELFFVDSLTTRNSVAWKVAKQRNLPVLLRDIFLDNLRTPAALEQQFSRAIARAQKNGWAVLIGHPYKETINFLRTHLPTLSEHNVRLRRIDRFLSERLWQSFEPQPATSIYQLNH